MKKKVLFFGGSFDPIHSGHLAMLRKVDDVYDFDRIVIIPAGNAPLKEKHFLDGKSRKELIEVAFNEDEKLKLKVEISDFELNRSNEYNYTYITLEELTKDKSDDYYFLIGTDQLENFHFWKEPSLIANSVKLICLNRRKVSINKNNAKKYNIAIIKDFDYSMSSSELRDFQKLDVPFDVLDLIIKKQYYWANNLFAFLKDDKYIHSFNVARIAMNIIKANNYEKKIPIEKAIRAALLHDVGKYFKTQINSLDDILKLGDNDLYSPFLERYHRFPINDYNNYLSEVIKEVPKACIHAFAGEIIAKTIFAQTDKEVLEAIRYHCTGNGKMSLLSKIIYCADKVDVRIGREGSHAAFIKYKTKNNMLEKSLYVNFDQGFQLTLDSNIRYIIEKGEEIHCIYTDRMVKNYCSSDVKKLYFKINN